MNQGDNNQHEGEALSFCGATSSDCEKDREASAVRHALRLIAYYQGMRDHSEKELKEKLARRQFGFSEIETALHQAKQYNWILPPEELAQKVGAILSRQLKSYLFICRALKLKGLPQIERDSTLEVQKILSLMEKKHINKKIDFQVKQKIFRQLSQKGFDLESIREAYQILSRREQERGNET